MGDEDRWTADDAEAAYSLGQFDRALDICTWLLERNPEDAEVLFTMAEAMLDMQEFEGAEEIYCDFIRLRPDSAAGYNGLGVAQFELCRFDQARRALETASELDKRIAECRMFMGYFHERRGEFDRARECFERAVDLAPDQYQVPAPLTDEELGTVADRVVKEMPRKLRDYLSASPWAIEALPPTSLLTRHMPPLSPMTLLLFLGPARDATRTRDPLAHQPAGIALYRANFAKTVSDDMDLRQAVLGSLLTEMELFLDLSPEEVEQLGLDRIFASHRANREAGISDALLAEFRNATIPPGRTLH